MKRYEAWFLCYLRFIGCFKASAKNISRHMAPVDTQNLAIPGAISPKIGDVDESPCKISRQSIKP